MSDYSELKRVAEAATPGPWYQHGGIMQVLSHDCETVCETFEDDGECPDAQFIAAANPAVVLGLIAHLDLAVEARDLYMADKKQLAFALNDARAEAARLKAECKGLRESLTHAADEVESWGSYASDYFQQKHDLAGTVLKVRQAAVSKESGQ
ncbi:hypothetical protein GHN92_05195 [Pseudomonas sp. FSL R10-2964]|uniref:ead/Ea22-like family protein n=1 Tax=Pseudomonas sp. FSL R10-2964 TaxID=2662202 RepID=UPI001294E7AF|nr:ead/Ea22-like family protein [Pseudomonas sp. FSL R10-2964]MQT83964.1 hypothetical protein [Pseudomonas sp. FSL R10-2964]